MAAFMLLTAAAPAPARTMERKSSTGALVPTYRAPVIGFEGST